MRLSTTKYPAFATFGLLFGATVWGILWYPYRLLEQAGISGAAASGLTYFVAILASGFFFMGKWRRVFESPVAVLQLALAAGWTNLAYVLAVIDGEVMRVLLLFYLSPLWTLVLAHLLLGEHAGRRGLFVICLSLTGAFTMLWHPASGMPLPQNQAEWLGMSAGMGFSLTNVLTRRASHLSLEAKSFAVWAGVCVLAMVFMLFERAPMTSLGRIPILEWLVIAGLGGILMVTTLLVQYGVTHTRATRASVIFLFELVVAALTSWLLAGEAMSLREWIGGAMIIAATIFAPQAET